MRSHLQLKAAHLLSLNLHAPHFSDRHDEFDGNFGVGVAFQPEGYPIKEHSILVFGTRVRLTLEDDEDEDDEDRDNDEEIRLYAECEGIFSLPDDVPPQYIDKSLLVNAATVLLGYLRGAVASISGNFRTGPLMVPCISMEEHLSGMSEEDSTLLAWLRNNMKPAMENEPEEEQDTHYSGLNDPPRELPAASDD